MIEQLRLLYEKISCKTQADEFIELLDKVGDFGAPIDVVYIIPYVFSSHAFIAQKAASTIRILMTKKEAQKGRLNLYYGFLNDSRDCPFYKKNLNAFEQFTPRDAVHLYGMASLNGNGYLREEALDYLGNLDTAEALPYVLLRLNDWVPQIQAKARVVLSKIFPFVSISDVIKHYHLIEWLGITQRILLDDVQEAFFKKLSSPENSTELLQMMKRLSRKERLFCCKALAYELSNDNRLIEIAMADPAAEIKQWIIDHLANSVSLKSKFEFFFSDRSMRVRYATLKAMSKYSFEEYRQFFDAAIFDDAGLVRSYARFILSSHGINHHADLYRQTFSQRQKKLTIGIVAGMAEISEKKDIPLIKPFLNDRHPEIRVAVLLALDRLNAEDIESFCILGIQDHHSKVRKICISILRSGSSHLRPTLEKLFQSGDFTLQKSVLKVLTHHYGVLETLKSILIALMQPSEALHVVAWQYFFSWHKKHRARLWFDFDDEIYHETLHLMKALRKINIEPPIYACTAWYDLPNILKAIERK